VGRERGGWEVERRKQAKKENNKLYRKINR
jgi:hypothetical protein